VGDVIVVAPCVCAVVAVFFGETYRCCGYCEVW
jgi:hypothetical protein